MNKKQESRANMYEAVYQALLAGNAHYANHPALTTAVQELGLNLNAIRGCVEKQVVDITGYAQAKEQAEARMVDLALVVSKAALAYGTEVSDLVLVGKMSLTRRVLLKHADGVVARHCQAVIDVATPLGAVLEPYGVDADLLDQLRLAVQKHDIALTTPRLAITTRKGATAELALLMKDTNKLVEFRIDGLMERYRLMRPAFHRDYMNARIVVDRGARPAAPKSAPKAAPESPDATAAA
jgi:hypothetical protein